MNDLWSYILKLVHALLFSDTVGKNKKIKKKNIIRYYLNKNSILLYTRVN